MQNMTDREMVTEIVKTTAVLVVLVAIIAIMITSK